MYFLFSKSLCIFKQQLIIIRFKYKGIFFMCEIESKNDLHEITDKLSEIRNMLIDNKKPFLSIDEASQYLGISKNTLYGYTSKGILPFYKMQGRKIYFRIRDIDEFVLNENNKVKNN